MRTFLFLFLLGSFVVATDALAEEKNVFSGVGNARVEVKAAPESEGDQKMNELSKKIYELEQRKVRSMDVEMSPRVEIYPAAKNSAAKRGSKGE